MKTKQMRILVVIGVLMLAALTITAVAWSRAYDAGQTDFQTNGNLISGSYWLKSPGHTATWTFNTAPFKDSKNVYINFNPLVTNGSSGGSGYSSSAKLIVQGNGTGNYTVTLTNPYRPTDPAHSGGIGYQAYGHTGSALPFKLYNTASTLKVTVTYPFGNNYHVAVNAGCMSIGYSK